MRNIICIAQSNDDLQKKIKSDLKFVLQLQKENNEKIDQIHRFRLAREKKKAELLGQTKKS